jgi:hypothetical protein
VLGRGGGDFLDVAQGTNRRLEGRELDVAGPGEVEAGHCGGGAAHFPERYPSTKRR